jgi:hypothetical protein
LAFLAFVTASTKSNYTKNRKQPTSLVYLIDADKGEAYYTSYESKVSNFNRAFLSDEPTKGSFDKSTTASKYNTRFKLHKKTNVYPIKQPIINKLLDTLIGNNRKIKLQIIPQRKTNRMELLVKDSLNFKEFVVNGENLRKRKDSEILFNTNKRKSLLSYYFTEENETLNLEFTLSLKDNNNPNTTITLYDTAYDLFTNQYLKVKPRNNEKTMPTPFVINDATIIKMDIKL